MRKLAIVCFIAIVTLLVSVPVSASPPAGPPGLERAIEVQSRHNADLLDTAGVVGTAVGLTNGQPVIQVLLERAGIGGIPASLEGIPVEPQVTGKITAIGPMATGKGSKPASLKTTSYWPRPVPIGVSTGNANENSAGTIGARVQDSNGNFYALSNNHVYAREDAASIGETVIQPGLYDISGSTYDPKYNLGTLSEFTWITMDGTTPNQVDAAIALTNNASLPERSNLGKSTPSGGYGTPMSATVIPTVGMSVQKFGRTSNLTKGTVTGISATIAVSYTGGTALFTNQIIVQSSKPFIKAGDSGSLLVGAPTPNPVGLLFAGNQTGNYAIANNIGDVLAAFNNLGFNITIDGQ